VSRMKRADWLLIVAHHAEGRPLQPVQLQKILFLLSRNLTDEQLGVESFYHFEPYDYGPFSSEVYSDAEELEARGLMSITLADHARFRLYGLTPIGAKAAAECELMMSREVRSYVDELVTFAISLSFNELVKAVYRAYPEMKVNSVFKEYPAE
jgi:hypothetical protein